ncbi:MAG: exodeoxyribonuclease V subunit gamma [Gammaproteobacteria bacterium]|nr:exodeoxyribonuclease V subunit gamma [Gammaproteobacteria bacterium]
MVIQSHRLETLRDLCLQWLASQPVGPMEEEVFLVQSNGIAQWLQMAMASRDGQGWGIAFGVRMLLPARFQWLAYRSVLEAGGSDAIPDTSPYDKSRLRWRLLQLIPTLLDGAAFTPLRHFLGRDPDQRKRFQLAERLADLYDQYQVYRADWLQAWQRSEDVLITPQGEALPLPSDQLWQAELWRAIRASLAADVRDSDRASIHQRFLQAASGLTQDTLPVDLPRRLVVFGVSALPQQTVDVLAKLAEGGMQVMFCMVNPCQFYWGDLIEHRELLAAEYRRQQKTGDRPSVIDEAELHLHAQPLLAAWGKQGRDFLHLLDAHDDTSRYARLLEANGIRVDLFEPRPPDTLLGQLQQDILDLRPLAETQGHWPVVDATRDDSLVFHVAHGPQRELEVLHDQLLAAFAADPSLQPRDVIVMVPDVATFAPYIHATFGQFEPGTPRHIPYQVSDREQRSHEPLLLAVEQLLSLPTLRLRVSEVMALLDVPAIRARFGLDAADLPDLQRWIEGANIRWGLDGRHRASLELPDTELHTWRFGLERMLLGYAVGEADPDGEDWQDIVPFDEVAGLEAARIGPLMRFLDRVAAARTTLTEARDPEAWARCFHELLGGLFEQTSNNEQRILSLLTEALEDWLRECRDVEFTEAVPLTIAREAWLGRLDADSLSRRFGGGAVTFATLMPMRAIPFEHVCLLGMNEGDYPRQTTRPDFDLMAAREQYRPGDRSRREDDRYLFLEALLAARGRLYVSWSGRSLRDNSEQPPSVLVGQLRDHVAAGWRLAQASSAEKAGAELLEALTTEHPLQPFSRDYFETSDSEGLSQALCIARSRRFTHASEWASPESHEEQPDDLDTTLPLWLPDDPISLRQLADFLVDPVRELFRQRLKIYFTNDDVVALDDEPFNFDPGLETWSEQDALLQPAARRIEQQPGMTVTEALDDVSSLRRRAGNLPEGSFGKAVAAELSDSLSYALNEYRSALDRFPEALEPAPEISLSVAVTEANVLSLADTLDRVRRGPDGRAARIVLDTSKMKDEKSGDPRWHVIIKYWPAHLALQIHHPHSVTCIISPAGEVELPGFESREAEHLLEDLLKAWHTGMQRILPAVARLGFPVLIAAPDSAGQLDGDRNLEETFAELRRQRQAFARCFPDLTTVLAQPDFLDISQRLYAPLLACLMPKAGASS